MALMHSTRVTAIAAAVAVMLGGAAIALAAHAAAPSSADLPGIASSRLPTATADAGGVPVDSGAGSSTPSLTPSPATTDVPATTGTRPSGSKPAVDLPVIPAAPDPTIGEGNHDDEDHEIVTPPVREDDDDDEDDGHASDIEEHRTDEASSTLDHAPEDDE